MRDEKEKEVIDIIIKVYLGNVRMISVSTTHKCMYAWVHIIHIHLYENSGVL